MLILDNKVVAFFSFLFLLVYSLGSHIEMKENIQAEMNRNDHLLSLSRVLNLSLGKMISFDSFEKIGNFNVQFIS